MVAIAARASWRTPRARFGNLSAAEIKLVRAAPAGDVAQCGTNDRDDDPDNDRSQADKWGPERQIRELCRTARESSEAAVHPRLRRRATARPCYKSRARGYHG
jgi:hypothetical protein